MSRKKQNDEKLFASGLVTMGNNGPPATTSATKTIIQRRRVIVIDWEHWLLSRLAVCGLTLPTVNINYIGENGNMSRALCIEPFIFDFKMLWLQSQFQLFKLCFMWKLTTLLSLLLFLFLWPNSLSVLRSANPAGRSSFQFRSVP